ncbi:MAG TPA: hypothetical protein PLJ40_05190 [Paludibacteraceae bacterium]|nr:hypothetical protein [Paludibacteraceae bacterium]
MKIYFEGVYVAVEKLTEQQKNELRRLQPQKYITIFGDEKPEPVLLSVKKVSTVVKKAAKTKNKRK